MPASCCLHRQQQLSLPFAGTRALTTATQPAPPLMRSSGLRRLPRVVHGHDGGLHGGSHAKRASTQTISRLLMGPAGMPATGNGATSTPRALDPQAKSTGVQKRAGSSSPLLSSLPKHTPLLLLPLRLPLPQPCRNSCAGPLMKRPRFESCSRARPPRCPSPSTPCRYTDTACAVGRRKTRTHSGWVG